jgi:hypothetical protein
MWHCAELRWVRWSRKANSMARRARVIRRGAVARGHFPHTRFSDEASNVVFLWPVVLYCIQTMALCLQAERLIGREDAS